MFILVKYTFMMPIHPIHANIYLYKIFIVSQKNDL